MLNIARLAADPKCQFFSIGFRTLLIVPRQTSWGASSEIAFPTRVGGSLMHGLGVNLHIPFMCCLVVAQIALEFQTLVLIIFV